MSGQHVGIAQARSGERSSRGGFLALGLTVVLLAGGLLAISSSAQAAPSDPPSVRTLDSIEMEGGQIFELVAENTNNDDTTSWDFDSTDASLEFQERVSDDERTYFLRTELPADYGEGDGFHINVTATDGAGDTDSSETTIYLGSDGEVESAKERLLATGELTETPYEDTDIDLRMDVDDHRGEYQIASVEVDANHPDGFTMDAEEVDSGTWEAGPLSYANPGIHTVGYTFTAESDAKFTVIDEMEVLENNPPKVETPGEVFVKKGQNIALDSFAEDPEGHEVTWRVATNHEIDDETFVDHGADLARWNGTIPGGVDKVEVTFIAEDPYEKDGRSTVTLDRVPNNPDLEATGPTEALEDTDVTVSADVNRSDASDEDVTIYKNYWWDGSYFDQQSKTGGENVEGDSYEATFNYGIPATHYVGYESVDADGTAVTLIQPIDIKEQAPELTLPGGMRGDNTQEVAVVFESGDSDNEDLTWDISASPSVDAEIRELEDTRIWQWEIPREDAPDQVDIDVTVTDSNDLSVSDSTTVSVGDALAEPELPEEVATGFQVVNPIVDHELKLATEVSDDTTMDGIDPDWPNNYDATLETTVNEDGLHEAFHTYDTPDTYEIGYVLEAANGGLAAVVQTIDVVENDAPEVDAYPDQECELECTAELRGHADDPEHRPPSTFEYSWVLVDSPDLSPGEEVEVGTNVNANHDVSSIGTHVFELRVTDPYGAVGVDDVTVDVLGVIEAQGALTNADSQADAGTYNYVMDPTTSAPVEGEISVVDHNGDPVDASVEGTVYYQNVGVLPELQVNSFELNTGADGTATFSYDKAVAGVVGGPSITDLPGSHEVRIDVNSGGLSDSVSLPYFVSPV